MRTGPNTVCYSVIAQQMWDRSSSIPITLDLQSEKKKFGLIVSKLFEVENEIVCPMLEVINIRPGKFFFCVSRYAPALIFAY